MRIPKDKSGEGTRYELIAASLRTDIENGVLQPGDRLPSNTELMRQHGASVVTVTRALRELQDSGHVESRRRSGVFVRVRRESPPELVAGKVVALLAPLFNDPFFGDMMHGVEEVCEAQGFRLLVAKSNFDAATEREQIDRLADQVAGLMIVPVTGGGTYAGYGVLLERKIPFVFLDRAIEGLNAPLVATDNEKGGYELTRHLIESGCHSIWVFSELESTSQQERLRGYRRALREAGIAFDPALVMRSTARNEIAGYALTQEWLRDNKKTRSGSGSNAGTGGKAIFAMNDGIARGTLIALKEADCKVPGDVAVAGFDDVAALHADPPLTSVRQDMTGMGREGARVLLDIVRFGRGAAPSEVRLAPEMVVRNSSDASSDFSLAGHFSRQAMEQGAMPLALEPETSK